MNLLKKIDHYLLTNHPMLWRTKVHYFILFSLVLGNVVAFGLGYFLVERYGAVETTFYSLAILLVIGFLGLIWSFSQIRIKIKTYKFWDEVWLFFIYMFCVGCLLSNSFMFERTVTHKAALLVSVEQVDKDYEILERHYQRDDFLSEAVLKELPLATLEKMMRRYKVSNRAGNVHEKTNQISYKMERIRYLQRCFELRRPYGIEGLATVYLQPYAISIPKYLIIWIAAFLSIFLLVHIKFRTFLLIVLAEFLLGFFTLITLAENDFFSVFAVSFALFLFFVFILKLPGKQSSKRLLTLFLILYMPINLLILFSSLWGFYDTFASVFLLILLALTPFASAYFIKYNLEPTV